jgi:hypothetical protein
MELITRELVYILAKVDTSRVNIPKPGLDNTLKNVLSIVFGLLGGISLLFIIYGGIKLITSQGTPEGFNKARNTIIYAIVGLVVSMSAFVIVNFVIDQV